MKSLLSITQQASTLAIVVTIVIASAMLFPCELSADGCYVPPPTTQSQVMETYGDASNAISARTQKAILWDKPDGYQLHLWVKVATEANEFGWFIPFPAVPEVKEGDPIFFQDMEEVTRPKFRIDYICWPSYSSWLTEDPDMETGPDASSSGEPEETTSSPDGAITIESEGTAGVFDYKVISAADPTALVEWLTENDYTTPDGLSEVAAEYTEKGWYFFTAKITRQSTEDMDILPPLVFDIKGIEKMSYPIKVTTLSTNGPWALFLWTISIDVDRNVDLGDTMPLAMPSNYPVQWNDLYRNAMNNIDNFGTFSASPKGTYDYLSQHTDKVFKVKNGNYWIDEHNCKSSLYCGAITPYNNTSATYNDISLYYILVDKSLEDIEFCDPTKDGCSMPEEELLYSGYLFNGQIHSTKKVKCCPTQPDTWEGCTDFEGGPVATELIAQLNEAYDPKYLDTFPNSMERMLAEKGILEPPLGMSYYPLTFEGDFGEKSVTPSGGDTGAVGTDSTAGASGDEDGTPKDSGGCTIGNEQPAGPLSTNILLLSLLTALAIFGAVTRRRRRSS